MTALPALQFLTVCRVRLHMLFNSPHGWSVRPHLIGAVINTRSALNDSRCRLRLPGRETRCSRAERSRLPFFVARRLIALCRFPPLCRVQLYPVPVAHRRNNRSRSTIRSGTVHRHVHDRRAIGMGLALSYAHRSRTGSSKQNGVLSLELRGRENA